MKNIYLIISIILCSLSSYSQVGINTSSPYGIFHIDGQANNEVAPLATRYQDDFSVSSTGNAEIGGLSTLNNKTLKINGSLQINDGTAVEDHVLQSDVDGKSTWVKLLMGEKSMIWYIHNIGFAFNGNEQNINGNGDLSKNYVLEHNQIGASLAGDNISLNVPKGEYFMTLNGDINGYEWGVIRIRNASTNELLKEFANRNWLTGIGETLTLDQDTRIKITYQATILSATDAPSFYLKPTYQKYVYYRLGLFKLNL